MANEFIPKRPLNDGDFTAIKANDRDCLSYAVAFNVPNERVFALFHPEFLDEQGKLTKVGKNQCRQFFSYAKNKEYADAYRETLERHLGGRAKSNSDGGNADISDDRIDNSFKSFLLQAIEDIEKGKVVDNETFKLYMELFKKLGRFKDDVEAQEAPRRYLPERCGSCLYRSFVESHVESGDIENACLRCKALKAAQEQDFRYDPKDLLEPIKESSDESNIP
jgi:hypothetical protein